MAVSAGKLTRRIFIQRATGTPDGKGGLSWSWAVPGVPLYARRDDVSDAERRIAGAWDNRLVTRFIIRASDFARTITRQDRILHDGITFEIDGITEIPDTRAFLEIAAKSDGVA